MITLYVKEQGAGIRRSGQRLIVYKGESILQTVRLREVERVVLIGSIDVSASSQLALLEAGVETVLLSYGGRFRGRLCPAEGRNVFLRQTQFHRYDDTAFRLRIAQTLVDAKIRNGRFVLQRYYQNHAEPALAAAIERMQRSRLQVQKQANIEALLGVEGDAARVYFAAFGAMMRAEFVFTLRSRRPPRDPVNALLSFGYTLLTTELTGSVAAQGLDPYVGVLHDLDYGRPSLALDLLEEFRQPVIDRLVLSLINRGVMKQADFDDRGEAGVWMCDEGRTRFLDYYHRALETPFEDRTVGGKTTFRDLLMRQAQRMRAALQGESEYEPYTPR